MAEYELLASIKRNRSIRQAFSKRSWHTAPYKYFSKTNLHPCCRFIIQSQSLQGNDALMERQTTPAPASVWHGMRTSHPLWSCVWSSTRHYAYPLHHGYITSGADAGDCTPKFPSSTWPRWTQSDGNLFCPNEKHSCPPWSCFPPLPCDCRIYQALTDGAISKRFSAELTDPQQSIKDPMRGFHRAEWCFIVQPRE